MPPDIIALESDDAPQQLMGWVDLDTELEQFDITCSVGVGAHYEDVKEEIDKEIAKRKALFGDGPRPFTWELEADLIKSGKLKEPFPVHTQDTGNCVAAGIEMLGQQRQVVEVSLFHQEEVLRPWFTPWIYAISRNQIGSGMRGAGSSGAWGARAINEFGVLFADDEGVPDYDGLSDRWGRARNAGDIEKAEYGKFASIASDNKIKIVKLNDVNKMMDCLEAGIMLSIASNWGFSVREYKGFDVFRRRGRWSHQMHFTDAIRDPFPGLRRGNQWGPNAHGTPKNGERPGGGWQLADDLDKELPQAVVYGFFDFQGEPGPIDPGIL